MSKSFKKTKHHPEYEGKRIHHGNNHKKKEFYEEKDRELEEILRGNFEDEEYPS